MTNGKRKGPEVAGPVAMEFRQGQMASTTARPACPVEAVPFRSLVSTSASTAFVTAASTALASLSSPKLCRNIIAADRIVPKGLAIPCPAMSGADPCTGS